MKRSHSAFTLVELLVVISIIVVLIGLLVPSMEAAAEEARKAKCAANLHAIHVGTITYASQNNGQIVQCRGRQMQVGIDLDNPSYPHNGPDTTPAERQTNWLAAMGTVGLASNEKQTVFGTTDRQHVLTPVWSCPSSTVGISYGSSHGFAMGYQYFGGITRWLIGNEAKYYNDGTSPVTSPTSRPTWVLSADIVCRNEGQWNYSFMATAHLRDKRPAGGNFNTMDGAVAWVSPDKLFVGHTWFPNRRIAFTYQTDLPTGYKPGAGDYVKDY